MKNIILKRDSVFSVPGGVLTSGDVNAYRLVINMGTDVSHMTAMAVCQENGEFSTDFECNGNEISVVLKNSMYSTPGFITVRFAVSDGISVLTAKEVIFRVVEANNDSTLAETESGNISNILTSVQTCSNAANNALIISNQALALVTIKADSDDVYTKAEVDGMLSSVYSYKGSLPAADNLPAKPETGDVYNILNSCTLMIDKMISEKFSQNEIYSWVCGDRSFQIVLSHFGGTLKKGDRITVTLPDGTAVSDNSVVLDIYDQDSYYQIICSGDFTEVPSTPEGITISYYASEPVEIPEGSNVAWTGSEWDLLSGTVDLTSYTTKEDVSSMIDSAISTALEGEY